MRASEVAVAAQMACALEAAAPKPGNVSRFHDFGDAHFEDWLLSAAAIGPAMQAAGEVGVGETVLHAVQATRRWVRTNTNLGIVLLLAPLARAALGLPDGHAGAQGDDAALRAALDRVLRETTWADAEAVYEAILLVRPGGLGHVTEQDVSVPPTLPLREVMRLAAERDAIAREYVSGFAITFEVVVPALRTARAHGLRWSDAAVEAYLAVLAAVPDSLIARKRGLDVAAAVSRDAAAVRQAGRPGSAERHRALIRFDRSLRGADNALNPGTSADLTAAALFVALLDPASPSGW